MSRTACLAGLVALLVVEAVVLGLLVDDPLLPAITIGLGAAAAATAGWLTASYVGDTAAADRLGRMGAIAVALVLALLAGISPVSTEVGFAHIVGVALWYFCFVLAVGLRTRSWTADPA